MSTGADLGRLDILLAQILRGDPVDAGAVALHGADAIRARALAHDVLPLVADRLASAADLPPAVRARFQGDVHAAVLHDMRFEAELRRVLRALAERGIDAVVIKGSHLAYTHYPRPDLRSRTDADLLIARASRDTADDVLTRTLGYDTDPKVSGEFTATQTLYAREEGDASHMVDLHWRLASPQLFAHVLSFEELTASGAPLPALSPHVRVPSDVHALVIACMHRVAHHHDEEEQFKWLYDIHLLASRFAGAQWQAFADLVVERGIAAVGLEGLERSAHWFSTSIPASLRADARVSTSATRERTAAYLGSRSQARLVLDDLRALPSWNSRVRLLLEHLFPSEKYMRTMYAPDSALPLPFLYVRRILRGAGGWLRKAG